LASERAQVVVVGSGFAGALLARLLATQGLAVTLIERARHPRFAIGESSTPLANLCLERLAAHYGQPDLRHLSAHGRWLEHLPGLRRGLKRGFSFYRHHAGKPYANGALNDARLLVAASPTDRVADTHWLRADVDHHFVREAEAAGVLYRDRTRVTAISFSGRGVRLRTESEGEIREVRAEMVVDATGPGGLLRRALPIRSRLARTATRSFLLFSHFTGARLFADVARDAGAALPAGPYPEDWAAVHHVLDEGWMYTLRFDHGVVSAGLLATPKGARRLSLANGGDASRSWGALLSRYPSLATQFQDARPVFPVRFAGRVQHRLAQAAGDRWVLLPHTFAFVDPLFSTGIAWSLLAVERLAEAFGNARERRSTLPRRAALRRYEALLAAEADQIDRLVAGSYLALPDFELFAAHAMLYFAVVSFAETRQRLVTGSGWEGFLGAGEPEVERAYRESFRRVGRLTGGGLHPASREERREFAEWAARVIASRNVAGLADPERRNLYPVDVEVLVERSHLLGLTPADVRRALPRLRTGSSG
jgi:tetracycline 7-halogenase / FADH2 O2-dependent halogenase